MRAAACLPPALIAAADERRLKRGVRLFAAGDPIECLFVVVRGRMALVRHDPDGRAATLETAEAGDLFAFASLFADAYHCDGIALDAAVVRAVPRERVRAAFALDSGTALAALRAAAQEVRRLRALLAIRNRRGAGDRLRDYLAAAGPTDAPLARIAAEIGVTPEALYRTVAKLVRAGKIRRKGRTLSLP